MHSDQEHDRRLWSVPLLEHDDPDDRTGAFAYGAPAPAGGRLLLTSSDGALLSLDPATGAAGASVPISGLSGVPTVVADGTVYVVTTGGELVALR
ncbi:MAG: PQQ-binding-like beta-propeller repeat protein [Pikeienuella sp.]|uniref:outer membrane protein assembly factor BamB family protein n=1 Tax=Pikeienuella sp. TaxID=2831957 RepID=UPI00391BDB1C